MFKVVTGSAKELAKAIVDAASQLNNSPFNVVAEDSESGWFLLHYADPDGRSVNNAYIFVGPGVWRAPPSMQCWNENRLVATYGLFIMMVREQGADPNNWSLNEAPQIFAFHPMYTTAFTDVKRCSDEAEKKLGDVYNLANSHPVTSYIYVDHRQITAISEPMGETSMYGMPWVTHILKWSSNLNPNLQRPVPLPHWALYSDGVDIIHLYIIYYIHNFGISYINTEHLSDIVTLSTSSNYDTRQYIVQLANESFSFRGVNHAECVCSDSHPIYGAPAQLNKSINNLISNKVAIGPMKARWGTYDVMYSLSGPATSLFTVNYDSILNVRRVARFYGGMSMSYCARSISDGSVYMMFPVVTDEALRDMSMFDGPAVFLGTLDVAMIAPRNSNIVQGDVVQLQDGRQYIAIISKMDSRTANLSFLENVQITYINQISNHRLSYFVYRNARYNPMFLIRYS